MAAHSRPNPESRQPLRALCVCAAHNLATPYTEQADFSVEQAIGKSAALTVSFMHSRGYKFISREDLNLGPATGSVTYSIRDTAGAQTDTFTTPTYLSANKIDS